MVARKKVTSPPSKSKKATASGAAEPEKAQQLRATDEKKVERKKATVEVWTATLHGAMSFTSGTGRKYLKDRPVPITDESELAELQSNGLFEVTVRKV